MEYVIIKLVFSDCRFSNANYFCFAIELHYKREVEKGSADGYLRTSLYFYSSLLRHDPYFFIKRWSHQSTIKAYRDRFSGFSTNPSNFRHIYVWSGVLQNIGWGSIMYISVLTSVDPTLHEAATVDGATRFQRLLHIDLPAIVPTMVIMLIMRAGEIMDLGFEKAFLLQNNINLDYSEIIATYVYRIGIQGGQFSYSSAIGLFNNVINMVLLVVVNKIAKKVSDVSLW